ncbi:hypothetical protein SAMN04490248_103249 [Salinihabitans flavidus]|uniref:Uncharacterized protein n=1 Tax=Salinihabitans flavidus TaxID=569882 RepID=A0A1H8NLM7_9RHOB|nr:hypothetical protein [Salinihabitans flavidus]SEO30452.1 hypothetical protein SAMN04490248_103249 [Salinihabitans flavidus]
MRNHIHSLSWELQQKRSKLEEATSKHSFAEGEWLQAEARVAEQRRILQEEIVIRDRKKDVFRNIHFPYTQLQDEILEIENEIFDISDIPSNSINHQ